MFKLAPLQRERVQRNYLYGDLSCDELIDLLENKIAPAVHFSRTKLVNELVTRPHRNLKAHTKGSDDKKLHYTVFVNGRGYHLRLDRRGIIFQITDRDGNLSPVLPWTPPGA